MPVIYIILLIILYAVLSVGKVIVQSHYSKNNINLFIDTFIFLNAVFLIIGISFLPMAIINNEFKKEIILYAFLNGLYSLLYQLFYTLAFIFGSVSLAIFFTSASSVINIVYSIIVFDERVTPFKIVAFVLFIFALIFNIKKDNKSINIKWVICVLFASVSLIICGIVTKYFAMDFNGEYTNGFLSLSYIISFTLCSMLLMVKYKQTKKTEIRLNKTFIISTLLVGLFLVGCVFLNQYITINAEISLYYPIRGGLCMVFGILSAWLIYKEKPTLLECIAMICGLLSVILVNF